MKRVLILCCALLIVLFPVRTRSQTPNRAGVVVQFGDGSVRTRCVSFAGESITGLELLEQSDLEVIAQRSGTNAAVCKIGPDGCSYPSESCFCQPDRYWAYWRLAEAWQYSSVGAGAQRVRNGEVDGWAWGTGNVQTGSQPPVIGFDQICPAVQSTVVPPDPPTAIPTAVPTVIPTRVPTAVSTIIPTSPGIDRAPSATIEPPTATIALPTGTIEPATTTATSAPTITIAPPSSTVQPTAQPTRLPTATRQSTATPVVAGGDSRPPAPPPTNIASYVVFGAMLAAVLAAIGVVLRKRPQ